MKYGMNSTDPKQKVNLSKTVSLLPETLKGTNLNLILGVQKESKPLKRLY